MKSQLCLGNASFDVARCTVECFVSADRLVWGVEIATSPSSVEVEAGEFDTWAPSVVADRLFLTHPGELHAWTEFGRRIFALDAGDPSRDPTAIVRVYESEPIGEGTAELQLTEGSQFVTLRGSCDLLCGANFDRAIAVDVACHVDRLVFLAGRMDENAARGALRRHLDDRAFVFDSNDGVAQLSVELRSKRE